MTPQADIVGRAHTEVDSGQVMDRLKEGVRLATAGELLAAVDVFRDVLAIDGENFYALSNLGFALNMLAKSVEAIDVLERARELQPDDAGVRDLLEKIYARRSSGPDLDMEKRVELIRWHMAADQDSPARIDLANLIFLAKRKAALADFALDLAADDLGRHVLIACMPKSGSSFLFQTLHNLTGWYSLQMSYAYMQNEEELYLPALRAVVRENTITQQHCRATVPNIQIVQAFDIRPIVLVRNLFDVIVSYSDFFDQGAIANTFFARSWGEWMVRENRI